MSKTFSSILSIAAVSALTLLVSSCGLFKTEKREAWRSEAEEACMKSGAVKESTGVRFRKTLQGPGVCGADYPMVVAALGAEGKALGFAAEPLTTASIAGPYSPAQMPLSWGGGPSRNWEKEERGRAVMDIPTVIAPQVTINCPMTAALQRWVREVVQPAAMLRFGQPVAQVDAVGAYACRRINNASSGHLSEHAFANAIDIKGFTLADGRKFIIAESFKANDERSDFLIDVQAGACGFFSTVLAPGSNAFHYDHIHLDQARRRSSSGVCRFVDYRSAERKLFAQQQATGGGQERFLAFVPPSRAGQSAASAALDELVGD